MTQTTIESSLLIRPVARFVAIGLFLMAFFTTLWALYGLPTVVAVVLVAIFVALSVVFVINGVQLIRSAAAGVGCRFLRLWLHRIGCCRLRKVVM
jgi:hypothetical protein